MLVEMAIGDAYGAGFEYVQAPVVQAHNDLTAYRQHPKWSEMVPGHYTDDTQMSLALAELMLAKDPAKWTPYDVAEAFVDTWRRDRRAGYAQGFYLFLQEHSDAASFLRDIIPHSAKSGGAMRSGVLGLLPDTSAVINRAMFQASLTHATMMGMAAAAGAALMVHYCYYEIGPKRDLPTFLWDMCGLPGNWMAQWPLEGKPRYTKIRAPGMHSARCALTALVLHDKASDILKAIVGCTGDTDTAATIAMAAASVCAEVEMDLPDVLYEGLESGQYGLDYLGQVDTLLLSKYPREEPEEG
jgi:ADP-ribosylglycohydrolase